MNPKMLENSCVEDSIDVRRDGRKNRNFDYDLNEKKAKAKLLKGARRAKHLNIEIKSGCVNMRFSDGAYFEVVLPLLRNWHKMEKESVKINDEQS